MRTVTSTLILIVLCIALLATQAGCFLAVAAAGTGAGVAYVRGDTDAVVSALPQEVAAASEAAAKEMNLTVTSNNSSRLDARVVARTASDTPVVVSVKAEGPEASRVSIRVGRFGDDSMQATMLQKIRQNLKDTATASAAE
jgi:N-acetylglutamate synthase/N-acetylornithine aminotransferase